MSSAPSSDWPDRSEALHRLGRRSGGERSRQALADGLEADEQFLVRLRCRGRHRRRPGKVRDDGSVGGRTTLDRLTRALEGIAFAVDQAVDRLDQRHVLRPVIAPAAAALERPEHRELLLPIAQDMLAYAESSRHFADGPQRLRVFPVVEAKLAGGVVHPPCAIRSLSFWLDRKVSTRRGVIGTSTPVFGLRPMRSRLLRRMKLPKPEILTFSPSAIASHILARMDSTSARLSAREKPILRLMVSARSARVRVPTDRIIGRPTSPLLNPYAPAP